MLMCMKPGALQTRTTFAHYATPGASHVLCNSAHIEATHRLSTKPQWHWSGTPQVLRLAPGK